MPRLVEHLLACEGCESIAAVCFSQHFFDAIGTGAGQRRSREEYERGREYESEYGDDRYNPFEDTTRQPTDQYRRIKRIRVPESRRSPERPSPVPDVAMDEPSVYTEHLPIVPQRRYREEERTMDVDDAVATLLNAPPPILYQFMKEINLRHLDHLFKKVPRSRWNAYFRQYLSKMANVKRGDDTMEAQRLKVVDDMIAEGEFRARPGAGVRKPILNDVLTAFKVLFGVLRK